MGYLKGWRAAKHDIAFYGFDLAITASEDMAREPQLSYFLTGYRRRIASELQRLVYAV